MFNFKKRKQIKPHYAIENYLNNAIALFLEGEENAAYTEIVYSLQCMDMKLTRTNKEKLELKGAKIGKGYPWFPPTEDSDHVKEEVINPLEDVIKKLETGLAYYKTGYPVTENICKIYEENIKTIKEVMEDYL